MRRARALLGIAVCLGFVLQQIFVPLHLGQNEHVYPGAIGAHVHSSLEHGHGHAHEGHGHPGPPPQEDEPHEPHPVEDHLDEPALPAGAPELALGAAAPPPEGPSLPLLDAVSTQLADEADSPPRPPPPRAAGPPRAPPIAA